MDKPLPYATPATPTPDVKSVWETTPAQPPKERGPNRGIANVALGLAWASSPFVTGAVCLIVAAASNRITMGGMLYLYFLPVLVLALIVAGLANAFNTHPTAWRERRVVSKALRLSGLWIVINALLILSGFAMLSLALQGWAD